MGFQRIPSKVEPTRPIPDAYKLGYSEEALTPTLKGEVKGGESILQIEGEPRMAPPLDPGSMIGSELTPKRQYADQVLMVGVTSPPPYSGLTTLLTLLTLLKLCL